MMRWLNWRRIGTALWLIAALAAAAPLSDAQELDAATRKFLAANAKLQRGLYKLAADEYGEFIRQHAAHEQVPTAKYAMAVCLINTGEPARAAGVLEELLNDPRFKQPDEALLALAHARVAINEHQKAITALDTILSKHARSPSAEPAALNKAQVLYLMGRKAEAAAACEAFLKAHTGDRAAQAMYFLALSQRDLNQADPAARTLQRMVKEHPSSPLMADALLLLGQVQEQSGRLDEAAGAYRRLIDMGGSRQGDGHFALGALQYRRQDFNAAIESFEKAAADTASQQADAARLQLAMAQLAAGRLAPARQTLQQIEQRDATRRNPARYWLAQCDIAERKYDAALGLLDQLAKIDPPLPNAERIALDRGQCLMGLERFPEAAAAFETFAIKYPADERLSEAVYHQAYCLHKAKQYDKSLKICRKLETDREGNYGGLARELAAENLFLLGQYEDAGKAFVKLIDGAAAGKKLRFTVRLGQCAYFLGDAPRAIEILGKVAGDKSILADGELARGLLVLGDALLQTGKNKEAAGVLSTYASAAPQEDKPEALFKLGLAQLRSGDDPEAARTFWQVMQGQSPWAMRAAFEWGQIAYKHKKHDEAAVALGRVAGGDAPAELKAPAEYLLAWIELDNKRYEPASQRFAEMAKRYPKHELAEQAMFYSAVALREGGEDQKAVDALKAYIAAHPQAEPAARARQLMAASLVKLQKHQEAIRTLSTLAGDRKTLSDEVLYDLAWSQQAMKDTKAAEQTYRRLMAEFPKSKLAPAAQSELGELLYQQGQYTQAVELLKQVVDDPSAEPRTAAVAVYRLGSCYEKLNQPDKAAATFTQFIAKNKDDALTPWAHYQAGANLVRLNKLAEATGHFRAGLAGKANDELRALSLLKLGETLAEQGSFDESERMYREFLANIPNDKLVYQAYFGVGWALENRKKLDESRRWYLRVIDATNTATAARAQFQIGETYFAEQNFEKAAANLLSVADVYAYPEWSARALVEAGRAFEQIKQPEQAKTQYRQVVEKYKDRPEAQLAAKRLAEMGER